MEQDKVPIGFGMALAMDYTAMEAYAALTEEQKQQVLDKARNARSEEEMRQIIAGVTTL